MTALGQQQTKREGRLEVRFTLNSRHKREAGAYAD